MRRRHVRECREQVNQSLVNLLLLIAEARDDAAGFSLCSATPAGSDGRFLHRLKIALSVHSL